MPPSVLTHLKKNQSCFRDTCVHSIFAAESLSGSEVADVVMCNVNNSLSLYDM